MSEKSNPHSPPANIKESKRKKKTLNITKFIMTVLKGKHLKNIKKKTQRLNFQRTEKS